MPILRKRDRSFVPYFAGNNGFGFGGHRSLPETTFDLNYVLPTLQATGDRSINLNIRS
ncbi:MAG: hypothetical protein AAF383_26675 [Cyanobacteria bacterium P01_A01_bin.83]